VVTLSSAIEEIVMKNAAQFSAALVGLATLAATVVPTFADDRCSQLWVERNSIYKQQGYCFKTERGINVFGNEGCKHHDEGAVPLSSHDRARIADIQRMEREQDCPK
jgi:YARHG domain